MTQDQSWRPAPRPGLVPLYPFGFSTALGKSFSALRGNPKVLLGFAVTVQTLAMLLGLGIIGLVAVATFSRLDTVEEFTPDYDAIMAGSIAIVAVTGFVVSLAISALSVIVQGVVVAEVSKAVVGERASLGTLWAMVRPRFWSLTGFFLLQMAAFIVVLAILAVPTVLGVAAEAYGWIGLTVVLGLAAIPLYAWLGTKLYLVPSVIVLEQAGPIAGIRRSWVLTRRRFWPTFGVMILISVIMSVASSITSAPLQLLSGFLPAVFVPFGEGDGDVGSTIALVVGLSLATSALQLLVSAITTIVSGTGGALMYVDARMRHEALDLRLQSYVEQRELGSISLPDPWTFDPSFARYASTPRPGFGLLTPEQAAAQQAQQAYGQQWAPQPYAPAQPQAYPGYPPQPQGYPVPPHPQGYPPQPQAYPGYPPQPQGYPVPPQASPPRPEAPWQPPQEQTWHPPQS
ncbi:hypothetical protein [Microbacterium stercoris]|uniref:DUF7847 domain-containing protein n=1 Tax=Microbacterium stercoris TaxID=2820289 RepID=A0A939QI15_9MICO|nr:hypothetical protein [Microbacterium stercoris]MBO3662052.1 hypothetical protein [Microbacterium stercoris]